MNFEPSMYQNFVAADSEARARLIHQYSGPNTHFHIIIIGSGVGGGVLADDLVERLGDRCRILLLEAGSFLYPTHVYNVCRFDNTKVSNNFACRTFFQQGNSGEDELFIDQKPQLNFGGRSIFWSGLIPTPQAWELEFFPPRVRNDLVWGEGTDLLHVAGESMNQSRSMGSVAAAVAARFSNSPLSADFSIDQTPRALHQPYLEADGTPKDQFFTEPTGVFNTAELLINQLGFASDNVDNDGRPGLHLLLNHFVEDVQDHSGCLAVVARDTLTRQAKTFHADKVVLACGSIESPKLIRRSSMYSSLPSAVQDLVGRGLTDHPTTDWIHTFVDGFGGIKLSRDDHAKIIFYSRGLRELNNEIRYPFNVEMNLNHEYWHLRKNDPSDPRNSDNRTPPPGKSIVEIKFSFGNCLDDANEVKAAPPPGYVPEIAFHNMKRVNRLSDWRFPALAGWDKNPIEIWDLLNDIARQIFSQFRIDGQPAKPLVELGQGGTGFGIGTVQHAAGSLRMPSRARYDREFAANSVVDEDLKVIGTNRLYACDMSVMPMSTAANPVRTLVALALRLSRHLEHHIKNP